MTRTNDTTRVTAENMPAIEAMEITEVRTPSIYRLIADYWVAYDFLMGVQDEGSEQDIAAGKRLTETEVAICAYIPTRAYEARVKADFINRLADEDDGKLDRLCTAALLSTIPALYAQEAAT